jgi:magnesium transporter
MTTVIAFDFDRKVDKTVSTAEAGPACAAGLYCWADVQAAHPDEAGPLLENLGFRPAVISEVLNADHEGTYDVYPDCLHFSVQETAFRDGTFTTASLDILLNERAMVTFHTKEVQLITHIQRTYREDFLKFSKSLGFLLYEIADHMIAGYRRTLIGFSETVEQVQMNLFGEVNDEIFKRVSALTRDLLIFRKVVLASRELMHELASRRSPFVSETTQPFLDIMGGTLERLGNDLSTERDVLTETLNLYMGMTSHRTSKVLKRLTMISIIFLPLTFLCGVYGMNFRYMPEIRLHYGYLGFWIAVISIASTLLILMKRFKWL